MTAAGIAAFEARSPERTGVYSFEQESVALAAPYAATLRSNPRASEFFEAQAASYRKAATWWVMSAKREETRARRLAALVDDSAHGRRLPHLSRRPR